MKKAGLTLSFLLCALMFAAAPSAHAQQKISFSKLVVLGDSLAAGVENGSLWSLQQIHGFPSVIARQANTPLTLPLVPYPGAPKTLELISPQFPPVIQPVPGALLFPRLNPFETVTNLAVPLQTVADALNRKPNRNLSSSDTTQLATDIVLGFPCPVLFPWCNAGSQVQQAVTLHPTSIIIELGSNDILSAVTSGQIATLTPPELATLIANFGSSYQTLLNDLAATHAALIVANIPNVIETAYFIPLAKLAQEEGVDPSLLATELGVGTEDYVTISAIPTVEAILTNSQPGPLATACPASASPCVITEAQALLVKEVISQLNTIIGLEAAGHGAITVDLYSLVDKIYTQGYSLGKVTLTSDFLGGLFSLDGLHPTNTGYAIVANEFIKDINASFGTKIAPANVNEIAACDPLVLSYPAPCLVPW